MSHLMPQPKIKLHSLGPLLLAFGPHVAVHSAPILAVLSAARAVAASVILRLHCEATSSATTGSGATLGTGATTSSATTGTGVVPRTEMGSE